MPAPATRKSGRRALVGLEARLARRRRRNGTRVKLGAKRQLTLPKQAADSAALRAGDYVQVSVRDDGVIELVPLAMIPRDQLYFWTPEWQAKEREADEDIKAGRYKDFTNTGELMRWLKS